MRLNASPDVYAWRSAVAQPATAGFERCDDRLCDRMRAAVELHVCLDGLTGHLEPGANDMGAALFRAMQGNGGGVDARSRQRRGRRRVEMIGKTRRRLAQRSGKEQARRRTEARGVLLDMQAGTRAGRSQRRPRDPACEQAQLMTGAPGDLRQTTAQVVVD